MNWIVKRLSAEGNWVNWEPFDSNRHDYPRSLQCFIVILLPFFPRFIVFSWCFCYIADEPFLRSRLWRRFAAREWASPWEGFSGPLPADDFLWYFICAFSCETVCGDKVVNFDTGVFCCVHNFTVYKPLLRHEKLAWLFHLADSSLTVVIRWSRARAWIKIKTQSRQGSVKNSFIYKEKKCYRK